MTAGRLATLFGLVPSFLMAGAAFAQPPPQPAPNCSPVYALPHVEVRRVMMDADGDWWVVIRVISTGRQQIGYVARGQFCVVAEGKTNPES